MPFPKKKEVVDFNEDEEIYGCPYDYDEELAQIEAMSKNKLKKVR
jgi:hypothetical protein